MKTRTTLWIILALFVMSMAAGALLYARLPEQVASHWNAQGQADGYSSRLSGVLMMPLMMLGLGLLLMAVPSIDPLRANIALFRADYNTFVVFFAAFFTYLHGITLAYNLGVPVNMNAVMAPAMGGLMYFSGMLIGKAKRNYFIGIRTPWTLANEVVWDDTHRRGAVLFKLAGVVSLLGMFWPAWGMFFLLIPVLAATVYVLVYSYVRFRQVTGA